MCQTEEEPNLDLKNIIYVKDADAILLQLDTREVFVVDGLLKTAGSSTQRI